jgi:hypothetical protein
MKFREYCPVSRIFPCGQTDRHDEANSLIFRNFAKAANKMAKCYSVPWSRVFVETLTVYQLVNKFRAFDVEPLSSFAFPQEPATFSLTELDESDPQRHALILQDQSQRFSSPYASEKDQKTLRSENARSFGVAC